MGISHDALIKKCEGRLHWLAEDLPALYRATQDLDLYADLAGARDCDLLISKRGEATGEHRIPTSIALSINAACGALSQVVADAARDDVFDPKELADILKSLETLERRAQGLRSRLAMIREKAG